MNPPAALGTITDVSESSETRLREVVSGSSRSPAGHGRAGIFATVGPTSKPRLSRGLLFPPVGSCAETAQFGKVRLHVAGHQASCPRPRPCSKKRPCSHGIAGSLSLSLTPLCTSVFRLQSSLSYYQAKCLLVPRLRRPWHNQAGGSPAGAQPLPPGHSAALRGDGLLGAWQDTGKTYL